MPDYARIGSYTYIHKSHDYGNSEKVGDGTGFLIGAFAIIAVVILAWLLMKRWSSTSFGKNRRFSKNKYFLAYIYLSSEMILRDVVDVRDKTGFVHSYLSRIFPDSKKDLEESLRYALDNPIPPKKIAVWIHTHLDEDDRIQVMYFLAGIAFIDGSLNSRERNLLRFLQNQLEISPKAFDQIIAMHTQQRRQEKKVRKTSGKTSKQLALEILGVSEYASWDEIKKAYRSLVKKNHPDRYARDSRQQQEIAQKRFIEIQKAYEFLEKAK